MENFFKVSFRRWDDDGDLEKQTAIEVFKKEVVTYVYE